MKTIEAKSNIKVDFNITLNLTPGEAHALHALTGYGADAFLEVFYKHMGKAYLEPHEAELRRLFHNVNAQLPNEISKIETAQKSINTIINQFK